MQINSIFIYLMVLTLTACKLGPNYQKPDINTDIPYKFKEAGIDWQIISPSDGKDKGNWWKMFKDPILDELEEKLNKHNYNIKSAASSYSEALALVDKARTNYLPSISASNTMIKQKQSKINNKSGNITSSHSLLLNATWEPDLWGNVSRTIESSIASAGVAEANLASVRLSGQSSLAQYYFELRMLDKDQKLLDEIAASYQAVLEYTKNRYLSGVADDKAVAQAEQQLQTAKTTAMNNHINRAQYQHAIAVLIGQTPSNFTIATNPSIKFPNLLIPISIPSVILERRPDIAGAERQVAIASAKIGINKSAFFPSLNLSSAATYQGSGISNLLSLPTLLWSVGPQLALSLSNLGAYNSTNKAAQENYNSSVASYRNIVLAGFQDVEDNMVALRILEEQIRSLQIAAGQARRILEIAQNQYIAGIADQLEVSQAQIVSFNAEKSLNDTEGLKISILIALIKSLGGGWEN